MAPIFQTDRFDVYHAQTAAKDMHNEKDIYFAFEKGDGAAYPQCVVTLSCSERLGNFVGWVEVVSGELRKGIGREIVGGLEKHVGKLVMDGATDEGDAFCAAVCVE